jgi:hypothetical protein
VSECSGFCGGGQGLSWAVEPRKEEEEKILYEHTNTATVLHSYVISDKYKVVGTCTSGNNSRKCKLYNPSLLTVQI